MDRHRRSHHSYHSHHSHHSNRSFHYQQHSQHRFPVEEVGFDENGQPIKTVVLPHGNVLRVDDEYGERQHFHPTLLDDPGVFGDEELSPDDAIFSDNANFVLPVPSIPGCPIGLELLHNSDYITINQNVEGVEINLGVETANRYDVSNEAGKRLYIASEDAQDCQLFFFAASRPFKIKIYDYSGREVISLWRPCTCSFCLAEFFFLAKFGSKVYVKLVHGEGSRDLGIICQTPCKFGSPTYIIQNRDGRPIYKIVGPSTCFMACEHSNPRFQIFDENGVETEGQLRRVYSGYVREFFTDADRFELEFPTDASPGDKALLMAAVFLIDFLHFEDQCGRGSVFRNNRCRLAILFSLIIAIVVILSVQFK